jgi:hypothetical protein
MSIHPGAVELCDDTDNDCDGITDEDDAADASTWFADYDDDGFGNPLATVQACAPPLGYTANDDDCDDTDMSIHPDAVELCDDTDNDCDGITDEGVLLTWHLDFDGDGHGTTAFSMEACEPISGFVASDDDCNDLDALSHPGAEELCDDTDNDCDGIIDEDDAVDVSTWFADYDDDGFGDPLSTIQTCTPPLGYTDNDNDCDDTDMSIHPDAAELCDDTDNDCDGITDEDDAADASTWFADADADGFGDPLTTIQTCTPPLGYTDNDNDCDDTDMSIHPDAVELCDDTDND